jgi:hypothetical protein
VLFPTIKEDIECGVTVSDSTWMGESGCKALLYYEYARQLVGSLAVYKQIVNVIVSYLVS